MDRNQFSNKQIKVGGTTIVELISTEYKDKNYVIEMYSENKVSTTGHVVIAKLFSNHDELPMFIFRWDHGRATMDIDIFVKNKDCKDLWKNEGYKGHWPVLINDEKREYLVLIEIPKYRVFEGVIRVGLLTELKLHDTVTISTNIDIKII